MTVTSAFGASAELSTGTSAPGGPTPLGECLDHLISLLRCSEPPSAGLQTDLDRALERVRLQAFLSPGSRR